MNATIDRLIRLITTKDSFLEAENVELNSLLGSLDPQQVPSEYAKEVAGVIDMMFLTNNVAAENEAHFNRIHQQLTRSPT